MSLDTWLQVILAVSGRAGGAACRANADITDSIDIYKTEAGKTTLERKHDSISRRFLIPVKSTRKKTANIYMRR
jgi:hypothetical protein